MSKKEILYVYQPLYKMVLADLANYSTSPLLIHHINTKAMQQTKRTKKRSQLYFKIPAIMNANECNNKMGSIMIGSITTFLSSGGMNCADPPILSNASN